MTRAPADDTIVALATPPGRSALAIVRVSGPDALALGSRVIRPFPGVPRTATLARVVDANDDVVDEAVVICYRAPSSFTGENAIEVICHGGTVAPALVAAAFVAVGARPADPGEFTRRALLNGKLDLLQAEAIGDLVDADTRSAQRVALAQLDGGLSRRVAELREHILALEAMSAYDIDFPEEDDGPVPAAKILEATRSVVAEIEALLETAPVGELVRAGAVVVIAGAPNVGKSSLFNALLGRRRAIVTEIPGTTRDALEAMTEADGWPIRLVDTAGLRDTNEVVERLGIEVSREYLERADAILACSDTDAGFVEVRSAISDTGRAPIVEVRTKGDLMTSDDRTRDHNGQLVVSAESGEGLADVRRAIAAVLQRSSGALRFDAPLLTRERHRHALERARHELVAFHDSWSAQALPAVVAAVHLREATRELEELVGSVDVENILDRVFSSFCVGK